MAEWASAQQHKSIHPGQQTECLNRSSEQWQSMEDQR
eukprot:CAMPEP_0206592494 /NCGR_PEP_ID=MMETSP0325_2-20121206/41000_1 /ASSEMBLY_ACC=CAM_ASM_000347 /TAXON_ID=2866 /ORGANISM="Crypthecodinium cohnii, Strain Seligo" /LENGTH=36 /DNA_ID= /DNA_START= /DNA_END= /DNA_ORIENTATION=